MDQVEKIATDSAGREIVFVSGQQGDPLTQAAQTPIHYKGYRFRSLSQYYFTRMALHFEEYSLVKAILSATDRYDLFAGSIQNFDYDEWNLVSESIMHTGVIQKFQQNKLAKEELMKTGTSRIIIVDENDAFWGNGLSLKQSTVVDPEMHPGKNRLGMLLMRVRGEIAVNELKR